MNLSIAIPYHGDRWSYVQRNIEALKDDGRISEICIVDDCSPTSDQVVREMGAMQARTVFPLRYTRNYTRQYALKNIVRSAHVCMSEWVCLLASDNLIDTSYIDAWDKSEKKPNTVYCPELARVNLYTGVISVTGHRVKAPNMDFTKWAGSVITQDTPFHWLLQDESLKMLLGTGNYIVPRRLFLDAMDGAGDYDPIGCDTPWINYRLLKSGAKLYVTPGMRYDHTVHASNTWTENLPASQEHAGRIFTLIKQLGPQPMRLGDPTFVPDP